MAKKKKKSSKTSKTNNKAESLGDALRKLLVNKETSLTSILDIKNAKDALGTIVSWAGKSKDEAFNLIMKETSKALAQSLEKPLIHLLEDKKLSITLELTKKSKTRSK